MREGLKLKNNKFDIDKYLSDLEHLVNIDSGSEDIDGIKKIAEFFMNKYAKLGWRVKSFNFDRSVGPCLEFRNTDNKDSDFLLLGHMDTVFPLGTVKQRSFKITDNRAYGPGVMDMKSGLLSIYYAVKSLNPETAPSICIALNSHEEISSLFAYPWIEKLAKESKIAFVTEPARANGALVKKRKGLARYTIIFNGVAAHAGVEPEKGLSSITELGHWIVALSKLTDYESGTTVNVGLIEGGTAVNVVAEKAKAIIDVRYEDQKFLTNIENVMNEMVKKPFLNGMKIEISRLGWRPPMNPSWKTEKLCKEIEKVAKELEIEMKWAATGGGSDGNFVASAGTPVIDGLGPIGGRAHSKNEYMEVDSVEPRIGLLRELLESVRLVQSIQSINNEVK